MTHPMYSPPTEAALEGVARFAAEMIIEQPGHTLYPYAIHLAYWGWCLDHGLEHVQEHDFNDALARVLDRPVDYPAIYDEYPDYRLTAKKGYRDLGVRGGY